MRSIGHNLTAPGPGGPAAGDCAATGQRYQHWQNADHARGLGLSVRHRADCRRLRPLTAVERWACARSASLRVGEPARRCYLTFPAASGSSIIQSGRGHEQHKWWCANCLMRLFFASADMRFFGPGRLVPSTAQDCSDDDSRSRLDRGVPARCRSICQPACRAGVSAGRAVGRQCLGPGIRPARAFQCRAAR